jgi:phage baseplate assembly protein W
VSRDPARDIARDIAHDIALRFVHPDLDPGSPGLHVSPAHGRLETVVGEAAVRQALLLLLSTRPGERVMRPDYGCDLHQLAFATNDETTAALVIHHVRQAILRWEPRIEILNLDATPDPENGLLTVTLEYRVRLTQGTDRLAFSLSLS